MKIDTIILRFLALLDVFLVGVFCLMLITHNIVATGSIVLCLLFFAVINLYLILMHFAWNEDIYTSMDQVKK